MIMTLRTISWFIFSIIIIIFGLVTSMYNINTIRHENLSIFLIFLALIIVTFSFDQKETFNERLEIFLHGSSQAIIIHTCYLFFLTTIFSAILEHTGSMKSAVNICLHLFPTWFILPGIFISTSFFTFMIGSSFAIMAACMPLAINIAHHIGCNPSLMAATIISGCMLGDDVVYIFIIAVLFSGLVSIINHNGGVDYLIFYLHKKVSNTRHAKIFMILLVALVTIVTTINSIAIVICGPMIKKIGHSCHIDPAETACILGVVSSCLQTFLPYAPQMIIIASIAQITPLSLVQYLYYQIFLLISLCYMLCKQSKNCSPKFIKNV